MSTHLFFEEGGGGEHAVLAWEEKRKRRSGALAIPFWEGEGGRREE